MAKKFDALIAMHYDFLNLHFNCLLIQNKAIPIIDLSFLEHSAKMVFFEDPMQASSENVPHRLNINVNHNTYP